MLTYPRFTPQFEVTQWTLQRVLEHQAATNGDKPCLQWTADGPAYSYAQTNAQVNRLAHGLHQCGIGKGNTVVILMPNCLDFLFAWFALNKLGAIEAPINTAYRGSFLEHQVNICGAETIIVADEYLERVEESIARMPALKRIIVWTRDGKLADPLPKIGNCEVLDYASVFSDRTVNPEDVVQPHEMAAILFTSGTTGLSKGVLMPHAQLYFFSEQTAQLVKLTGEDTYMTGFPLFHGNAQFMTVYPCLIAGARCVLYERFSATEWVDRLHESGATVTNSLGVTLPFVYSQPPTERDNTHKLWRIFAAPTPYDILDQFKRRFGIKEFVEAFGQTEICVPFMVPMGADRPRGSCGVLVDQYFDVRLVNSVTDADVPEGEVGELVVRPKADWILNAGYSNMPEKTVEAYRNLWFHTGDGLRRDPEGWYYFIDRVKDALRRRGENISSFEVEAPIRENEAVEDVAVIGVPADMEAGEDEVKACVVLKPGKSLTPEELIAWCEPRMPHFVVPRYIEFVPELPKTPSEKIQKAKLREAHSPNTSWDRVSAGYRLKEEIAREERRRKP